MWNLVFIINPLLYSDIRCHIVYLQGWVFRGWERERVEKASGWRYYWFLLTQLFILSSLGILVSFWISNKAPYFRYLVLSPQMLNARIGNHVEIGANTCIDRGRWDVWWLSSIIYSVFTFHVYMHFLSQFELKAVG